MFEDFKSDFEDLNPLIKKKAIEIAQNLVEKEGYEKEKAIKEGIKRAEEWFFDLEG